MSSKKRYKIGILIQRPLRQGADQLTSAVAEGLVDDQRNDYVLYIENGNADLAAMDRVRVSYLGSETRLTRMLRFFQVATRWRLGGGKYAAIRKERVDLLVTTSTASLAGFYAGVPYTCNVNDLMHRFYPGLKEYGARSRWVLDRRISLSAQGAVICTVDSECGRQHLHELYDIPLAKIRAIPYVAPRHIYQLSERPVEQDAEVAAHLKLPARFLFYPAQFWEHKNHRRLLAALAHLRAKTGTCVSLVLAGADRNCLDDVVAFTRAEGLEEQVRFMGYVSDEELAVIYRRCAALIFPSLAGPTNIPLLEAMVFGKPVLCSRLFAMPDQVADAGLCFDPFDVADISAAIGRIWDDRALRARMGENGRKRAAAYSPREHAQKWIGMVHEALALMGRGD